MGSRAWQMNFTRTSSVHKPRLRREVPTTSFAFFYFISWLHNSKILLFDLSVCYLELGFGFKYIIVYKMRKLSKNINIWFLTLHINAEQKIKLLLKSINTSERISNCGDLWFRLVKTVVYCEPKSTNIDGWMYFFFYSNWKRFYKRCQ